MTSVNLKLSSGDSFLISSVPGDIGVGNRTFVPGADCDLLGLYSQKEKGTVWTYRFFDS